MLSRRKLLWGVLGSIAKPALGAEPRRPSWRSHYKNDFRRPLGPEWYIYDGQPGGDPVAFWSPVHCKVSGGVLTLSTFRDPRRPGVWTSAGVQLNKPLTYGKYAVRMRCDQGDQVSCICILWPTSNKWPDDGEIDFYEDGGGDRTRTAATLHYGTNNTQINRGWLERDFTEWHVIGVEWTPGLLSYTIDGSVWDTVSDPGVPDVPMNLCLQAQTWADVPTIPALVNFYIDSVEIWRYVT